VPAVVCIGSSSNLDPVDCANWATTVRSSSYFAKANPPACQDASHLEDPCSCTGIIGCEGGRIVSVKLNSRKIAIDASQDASLSLLSGLQHLEMSTNSLLGPVPAWLMNLTSLNCL
jgi:hypothetical protein